MNPYERVPQTTARRRRTERYGSTYETEPSMIAPQPMPGASVVSSAGHYPPAGASTGYATPTGYPAPVNQQPAASQPAMSKLPATGSTPPMTSHSMAPVQVAPPAQSRYPNTAVQQQSGTFQPYDPSFQQPYSAQPAQKSWSQQYEPQPGDSAWSQPYNMQPVQNDWQRCPAPQAQGSWQSAYYGDQPSWQQGHGGGKPPRRTGDYLKYAAIAALIVVVVIAAVIGGTKVAQNNQLRAEVTAYDALFCQGVYVDGIHLGGMTQEQAMQLVNANAQQRRDSWNVRLTYQGGLVREINANDLGMAVNVDDALAAAWEQGHETSDISARKATMDALLTDHYYGTTALPSGDVSAIDSILQEIARTVYRAPQDAQLLGFNAMQVSNPFSIQPEVIGRELNVEPLREKLYDMVSRMETGSIEVELKDIYPSVTTADVQKQVKLRGSAYTEISTTSTEERKNNIRRAFELISGTVLQPGDTFSFNGIVGERSAKNGFYQAIEYAYGEERMGYGGGVCQASTTVYLAAVRSNLQIIKREPHSDKVNYTEYGLDATVNYDGKKIDLTFKNDTGSNVYIIATVQLDPKISKSHYICKVDIYGPDLGDGVTYDLIAETVEVLPAPEEIEWREDKKATYVTYIDQEHVYREAKEGCKVDSYKVKYIYGAEAERTFMYQDTYAAKKQIIYVGVTEREDAYWQNGGY
ncbi:MAG: VanW family protein [Clostridia bacterium]|nr:VanW family protein [Clostridia bacterium]